MNGSTEGGWMGTLKICDICRGVAKDGVLYGLDLQKPKEDEKYQDSAEKLDKNESYYLISWPGLTKSGEKDKYEEYEICATCRERMSTLIAEIRKRYTEMDKQLNHFGFETTSQ